MYAKIYQKFTMVNCKNNLPFTDLLTGGVKFYHCKFYRGKAIK